MGGNVFNSSEITTPRIPLQVYSHVRFKLIKLLQQLYHHVDSPIEAPSKPDYGDVDILVAEKIVPEWEDPVPVRLCRLMGATQWKRTPGSDTIHLAVPWPEEFEYDQRLKSISSNVGDERSEAISSTNEDKSSDLSSALLPTSQASTPNPQAHETTKFIQVDIHICRNHESFQWIMFQHSHGDFWSMVGSIIRPFGLTLSNTAFYIRIPELEQSHVARDAIRVELTSNPSQVLKYLGFQKEKYWTQFDSLSEMMEYAATCRFFSVSMTPHDVDEADIKYVELQDIYPDGRKLKSNDRQRHRKRPQFNTWISEFLPQKREFNRVPGSAAQMSREEVISDAKSFFGSEWAEMFDRKRVLGNWHLGKDRFWSEVRRFVLAEFEGADLARKCPQLGKGHVLKGLKELIVPQDMSDGQVLVTLKDSVRVPNGRLGLDGMVADEKHKDTGGLPKSPNPTISQLSVECMKEYRNGQENSGETISVPNVPPDLSLPDLSKSKSDAPEHQFHTATLQTQAQAVTNSSANSYQIKDGRPLTKQNTSASPQTLLVGVRKEDATTTLRLQDRDYTESNSESRIQPERPAGIQPESELDIPSHLQARSHSEPYSGAGPEIQQQPLASAKSRQQHEPPTQTDTQSQGQTESQHNPQIPQPPQTQIQIQIQIQTQDQDQIPDQYHTGHLTTSSPPASPTSSKAQTPAVSTSKPSSIRPIPSVETNGPPSNPDAIQISRYQALNSADLQQLYLKGHFTDLRSWIEGNWLSVGLDRLERDRLKGRNRDGDENRGERGDQDQGEKARLKQSTRDEKEPN